MPKAQTVATVRLERGIVKIDGYKGAREIIKPPGCLGLFYIWESKAAAKRWYGDRQVERMQLIELDIIGKPKK